MDPKYKLKALLWASVSDKNDLKKKYQDTSNKLHHLLSRLDYCGILCSQCNYCREFLFFGDFLPCDLATITTCGRCGEETHICKECTGHTEHTEYLTNDFQCAECTRRQSNDNGKK